jgi:hypothetical protein
MKGGWLVKSGASRKPSLLKITYGVVVVIFTYQTGHRAYEYPYSVYPLSTTGRRPCNLLWQNTGSWLAHSAQFLSPNLNSPALLQRFYHVT